MTIDSVPLSGAMKGVGNVDAKMVMEIVEHLLVDNEQIKEKTLHFLRGVLKPDALSLQAESIASFVVTINESMLCRRTVLFVSRNYASFPTAISAARYFRLHGYATFGIYLNNIPEDNEFDHYHDCGGSLAVLVSILAQIRKPLPVYLQGHGKWAVLSALLRTILPQAYIIHEVYDWISDFIGISDDFVARGLFSREEIELVNYYESNLDSFADVVLYKNYSRRIPSYGERAKRIFPIVAIESGPKTNRLCMPSGGSYRFIFAGQVKSKSSPEEIYGDIDFIDLIQCLTAQGIDLTYYNAPLFSHIFPRDEYDVYFEESERNQRFSFREGIPRADLIREMIGGYHAGLILYRKPTRFSVGADHIAGAFDSKVFTYLEGGLPILISEEFEYMAEFVETNGVGVVVSAKALRNLTRFLDNVDFNLLQENIFPTLAQCNNNEVFSGLMASVENISI